MKKCSRCKNLKEVTEFPIDSRIKCGHSSGCLVCIRSSRKAYSKTPAGTLSGRWHSMMTRCYSPRCSRFAGYGGRGIKVCARWKVKENFIYDIISLLGPPMPGMSLDRIDNSGDYHLGNVRWATIWEQNNNRRPRPAAIQPNVGNTSGAVGVTRHRGGRWVSKITYKRKFHHLGLFDTVEDAARARATFLAGVI